MAFVSTMLLGISNNRVHTCAQVARMMSTHGGAVHREFS